MNNKTMDQIFKENLPNSLYHSHYKMTEFYGFTPQEWRAYFRDQQTFIESELAAIAEAEARSALSRLSNASGNEVQALKAILEKSKLINDAQRQSTKIIILHMPKYASTAEEPEPPKDMVLEAIEQSKTTTQQAMLALEPEPTIPIEPPTELSLKVDKLINGEDDELLW